MIVADGSPQGKVDPAYEAHSDVFVHWAQSMWNSRIPVQLMQVSLADAMVRTASAVNPWSVVYGPAAALVCTADRLGWTIQHATSLTTDAGRKIDLLADPPIVVKRLVARSVRSWRWRTSLRPTPRSRSRGMNFGPIYKLLNSKRRGDEWNPRFIGALKSVLANRQYTQQRCMAAGWVEHGRCLFCLHAAVTGTTIEAKLQAYRNGTDDQEKREQQKRLERAMEAITETVLNDSTALPSHPSGPPPPKPPPPVSWPPRSKLRERRWER